MEIYVCVCVYMFVCVGVCLGVCVSWLLFLKNCLRKRRKRWAVVRGRFGVKGMMVFNME